MILKLASLGRALLVSLKSYVYVDGQPGRENRDVVSGSISQKVKMFLNGGFVVALDTEGHCENPISGPGR